MTITTTLVFKDADYYAANVCTGTEGWIRLDTCQDAQYFGVWYNEETFTILTFIEGEEVVNKSSNYNDFTKDLGKASVFYMELEQ